MSQSAQRLTCYALLSAMECDMRLQVEVAATGRPVGEIIPEERISTALQRRAKDGLSASRSLRAILDYLDFGHIYEALRGLRASLRPQTVDALEAIKGNLEKLIAVRNRVAHSRPMEIEDTAILIDAATDLLRIDRSGWEELDGTISRLETDPSYVLGLTITLPKDPAPGPQHNLPIPDFDETGFLGRKKELRTIKRRILGAYPVVSVLGDGGVGKTAIALKAAYDILADPNCPFEAIVWVTAKATILTPHEIQRVSGAIESSLGLFAAASAELGPIASDPVEELYTYLETFKILLILDNLETVLDATLREFLLDLPMGSKVLLTSRVAVGVENPVPLEPMSLEESTVLLRALSRSRGVSVVEQMDPRAIERLVSKMAGHPAYIKWFVSGVQAGSRPEDLFNNSGLILDFCMSNVYEYLTNDARTVLACMQVLPGARNQAELAFLGELNAQKIQSALLMLMTTSFISMSHSSDESFDTMYRLSEFAQQYLDKHHPVPTHRRKQIRNLSDQLRAWGTSLSVEVERNPLSPMVVNIRSRGDVGVARLLRDAISCSPTDLPGAVAKCKDAQSLAPGYYEPWRVEGLIRARAGEVDLASAAYRHAMELAPESEVLAYHYGDFLLNVAGDPSSALELLQIAARFSPESYEILGQIAWAHYLRGSNHDAIVTAGSAAQQRGNKEEGVLLIVARAAARELESAMFMNHDRAIEVLESAMEILDAHAPSMLSGEVGDWFLVVAHAAEALADRILEVPNEESYAYVIKRARQYAEELRRRVRDASGEIRFVGQVSNLHQDKGYGFLVPGRMFFHVRDCVVRADWDMFMDGSTCVFSEAPSNDKGRRARAVRLMGW